MGVKMIVTDLDCTLLRSDKSISEFSRHILRLCKKQGIKVVFATARPIRVVKASLEVVACDAVIYHNGAIIHCSDKELLKHSIPIDDTRQILLALKKEFPSANLSTEIDDTLYANFDVSIYWRNTDAIQTDFSDLPNIGADKIIVGLTGEADITAIQKHLTSELYAQISEDTVSLIMNKDATKWNGVKMLAKRFSIDEKDIVAFGDDHNDIEMLNRCGTGVAMSNAINAAKDAADYVTLSNDEDGVAVWLKQHVLYPYTHIMWDWNGTLLNDAPWSVEVINKMLEKRNIKTLDGIDDYRKAFCFPVVKYYEDIGFDFSIEAFDQVAKEFIESYHSKTDFTLHEKALDILSKIKSLGITQLILSASEKENLMTQINAVGVASYFSEILGLSNIYAKSKEDVAKAYIQYTKPERILLIGDTVHDFEVAEAIGADCLLIGNGHQSNEMLVTCGVPVLNDISCILDYL